ncbi:glutamate receptor ionotropic, kainate 2-like [Centruroides sculpturatus]|uniref:glutamate receptor ionotropic, kainate 2-like n=1 Tax=Centruroides sculpturatus TaxID=218467 RepID=UPI000C6D7849|nr:glutamate receptor ionotropic, kainate 2-like [Centruroides sculpturatus]
MFNTDYFIRFALFIIIVWEVCGNLNESVWKISGLGIPGFLRYDSSKNIITGGELFKTFCVIQEKLQFKYELVTPIPKSFGREQNGKWNGMIGQLSNREADIAFVPVFITYERFMVVDYSSHVSFSHMSFLVRTPQEKPNWTSLIKPYSKEMWLAIFLSLVVFTIIFYWIIKMDFKLSENNKIWPKSKVFWLLFGSLTLKGAEINSLRKLPSRLIIGIWWLCIVVLVSSYSGTLMSFLMCPFLENVPNDFDELATAVTKGEYSCAIPNNQAMIKIFMESKSRGGRILAENINRTKGYLVQDAFEKVLKGKFVYIGNEYAYKKLPQYGVDNFILSEDSLVTFTMAYAIRRGFRYKKEFSEVVSHIFESGIIQHLEKTTHHRRKKESANIRSLHMEDLFSPLLLLLLGYVLSLLCFIVEMFIGRNNKRNIRSNL